MPARVWLIYGPLNLRAPLSEPSKTRAGFGPGVQGGAIAAWGVAETAGEATTEILNEDERLAAGCDLLPRFRRLLNRRSVRDLIGCPAASPELIGALCSHLFAQRDVGDVAGEFLSLISRVRWILQRVAML